MVEMKRCLVVYKKMIFQSLSSLSVAPETIVNKNDILNESAQNKFLTTHEKSPIEQESL